MARVLMAAFDQGGLVIILPAQSRKDRISEAIALRAWVGRRRRVGLSYWSGGHRGLPLVQRGDEGVAGKVFKGQRGALMWIRLPRTGWCLATHRRKP